MEKLKYAITDSVNRWHVTPVKQVAYESPYKTFDADINPGEGYVQIIYPVREIFLKDKLIDKAEYYSGSFEKIYFPFENGRVESTTFIHTPHYISFYARTFIEMDNSGNLPFELFTCGGVRIWVNGREVLTFSPYTRNVPSKKSIILSLEKGENEILVYADELAERDVFFYFELRYKGDKALNVFLPVDQPEEKIKESESFLESCYFERDIYTEGDLRIHFDKKLLEKRNEIIVTSPAYENTTGKRRITIKPGSDSFSIGDVKEFKINIHNFLISLKAGKYEITRNLVAAIYDEKRLAVKESDSITMRKKDVLSILAEIGEEGVQKTIAIVQTEGQMTHAATDSLERILRKIERKEDCADFSLGSLLLLLDRYGESLEDDTKARIKDCFLDFRYWIDEPGNDVMWFFSENHALLFHIGQYLAGNYFSDDNFTVSNRTGREQYEIGRKRLLDWFEAFFKYGYGEWNSTTYLPVDLIGFFTLYEMAPDEDIKDLTKKALDFTFKIIAYNSFGGIMSSSVGRTYEHTIKGRELNAVNLISYISCGRGKLNGKTSAAALYCVSSYEPGDFFNEVLLEKDGEMTLEYMQGESEVQTYLYKTNDYQMASAIDFKPFKHGHQQHVSIVSLGKEAVQFFVNHPGEKPFSGGGRPSYWAGNGTNPLVHQYKNITLMLTDIEDHELVKYIHAYSPLYAFDMFECHDKWFFAQAGEAYLGVYFANAYEITESGANTGKELTSRGIKNGVVIKTGSRVEHGSISKFINLCRESEILYVKERGIFYRDSQYGDIEITYSGKFKVEGKDVKRKRTYSLEPEINKMETRR